MAKWTLFTYKLKNKVLANCNASDRDVFELYTYVKYSVIMLVYMSEVGFIWNNVTRALSYL